MTPGSRSTSSSQATPGLQGSTWSSRARTVSTTGGASTNSGSASSRDASPMSHGLPPPLDQPQTTTNALPSSYLSATDPDLVEAGEKTETFSRTGSVLAQPSSTTSLSSLGSGKGSVASSYLPLNDSQLPTPPAEMEGAVPTVVAGSQADEKEEEEDALVVGGERAASPVGSTLVEPPESVAESIVSTRGSDVDDDLEEELDAPGTPKAELFALVDEAAMERMKLDPEEEPEIEEAEVVPALVAKEAEGEEKEGGAEVSVEGLPEELAVEGKGEEVGSWVDGVAASNDVDETDAIPAEVVDETAVDEDVEQEDEVAASTTTTTAGPVESAASPPSLGVPAPEEDESSVYHTPTLEYPESVSDVPSDNDDDALPAAKGEVQVHGLTVDVGKEDEEGLMTPKSATVRDFRGLTGEVAGEKEGEEGVSVETPTAEVEIKVDDVAGQGAPAEVEAEEDKRVDVDETPTPAGTFFSSSFLPAGKLTP